MLEQPGDDLDRLVARACAGDEGAFRALFDSTYQDVCLFVAARTNSGDLVDEVVQSTYVRAFELLGRYRPGGTFPSWLKGIASNLLKKELERRRRLDPLDIDVLSVLPEPAENELSDQIARCLQGLSPTARILMELRFTESLPVQDIAVRLKRSASSISVSLFRLRESLARCLGPGVVPHG